MTFLLIADRELRVRSRLRSTVRFRVGGALVAIVIVGVLLAATNLSDASRSGGQVFGFLAGLALAYCVCEGARNTADCLSEEKRAGTLGLLFLTDLRGYDIVLGKLLATSLNSFYALLAVLPPLAIPVVLGGVTGGEFWRMVLVLVCTLAISVTSGLFVSALTTREGDAWVGTLVVIGFLLAGPVGAFRYAFDKAFQTNPGAYWAALLPVVALGGLQLAAACLALPRMWRESASPRRQPWLLRLKPHWMGRWMRDLQGQRKAFLSPNPVLWLATRWQAQPVFLGLLVPLMMAAGIGALLWLPPASGLAWFALGAVLVHLGLAASVAWLTCHAAVELRQSGMLELLLTAPVAVPLIVEGHFEALKRLFRRPLVFLFVVEWCVVFWICLGAPGHASGPVMTFFLGAIVTATAVADLHAAGAYGFWVGLGATKVGPAVTRTVLFVLVLPIIAMLICPCSLPVTFLIKDLLFISYARSRLLTRFRAVATGEPSSPRAPGRSPWQRRQPRPLPGVLEG